MTDTEWKSDGNGGVVVEKKPPLGARPAWIAQKERIYELVEAIRRYTGTAEANYRLIGAWAFEIYGLCKILDKLEVST
jgi:hypothetical protein